MTNWDRYQALAREARSWLPEDLWFLLWAVLLGFKDEQSDRIAGFLLLELDPEPRESLESILSRLSQSHWYLSNREVPFYLVARFGKGAVLASIRSLLSGDSSITHDGRVMLEGVQYWARYPTAELANRLHYFEWQEAIEGSDG